ncbi:MAG TPA: ribose-phosphate diphosphokinase [Steroidobacteraceae bacterium]|nr:ribose-phosphate diphosphokinase [Steroidobacteraceae bacterium]
MTLQDTVSIFAPAGSAAFGSQVASHLGVTLCVPEEREFDGGEHKIRSLQSVRGRSVYIIQCLHGDALGSANDRLCRLLFFVGALKDAGARSVSLCLPYLAYARKDQRTKARDPTITRYVAQMVEAVGADRVMILEAHNRAAIDNAYRIETLHLEATAAFVGHFAQVSADRIVASPDIGGVKRARHFKEYLEAADGRAVDLGFMDKKRSGGTLSGDTFVGEVRGRQVILIDDLISSGNTIRRAVTACREAGAARIDVAVTHGVFDSPAHQLFAPGGPDSILITDSVPLAPGFSGYLSRSLRVVSVAPLFAEAIRRLELGGSLSELAGVG